MSDLTSDKSDIKTLNSEQFSKDPNYIGSFCRGYDLVHQFRDNVEGIREEEVEMSFRCSATYAVKRAKAIDKIRNLTATLNKTNVLSKVESEELKTLLHVLQEFVTYTPKVEETLNGVYVNHYTSRQKLSFLQTLIYRLFGKVPLYDPVIISNKAYSKLDLLWVNRKKKVGKS